MLLNAPPIIVVAGGIEPYCDPALSDRAPRRARSYTTASGAFAAFAEQAAQHEATEADLRAVAIAAGADPDAAVARAREAAATGLLEPVRAFEAERQRLLASPGPSPEQLRALVASQAAPARRRAARVRPSPPPTPVPPPRSLGRRGLAGLGWGLLAREEG